MNSAHSLRLIDSVHDDMIEYDGKIDEIVNVVPVFPKRNFVVRAYIIKLTLQSDVTMLRTINRPCIEHV